MADSGFFRKDVYIAYNVKNEVKKRPFQFSKILIRGFLGLIILTLGFFLVIRVVSLFKTQLVRNPLTYGKTAEEIALEYQPVLDTISVSRVSLMTDYSSAKTVEQKNMIERKSQNIFYNALQASIFPYWMATEWSFEGMTDIPGIGSIACGYFVTTVLRDTGVKLERTYLAQQASENIIKSLISDEYITRYSNVSIDKFLSSVEKSGYGLYIVGLDKHIGFLQYNKEGMFFIHSTYMEPFGVVKEPAENSYALVHSKYRVLGDLIADTGFIRKWLAQEEFETVR